MNTKTNTTTKTAAINNAATQPKARKTKVAAAASKVSGAQPEDTRIWGFTAAKEAIANITMPSWMKTVLGFTAFLVTFGCTYYVGITFTVALATLVAQLTLSMFLVWMTLFLGQVISILLSLYSAAKAQQFIVEDGYKTILAAPAKIMSWLGRAKAAVNATAPA